MQTGPVSTNASMLDKHRQAFQEEAREILVELESSLLELNEIPEDVELVGRVFRAMHTIKGSGAMFGFDKLASFTHHLETAFDEVRNGHLKVTPALVDISLEALDQIKRMVEETSSQASALAEEGKGILAKLRELTGGAQAAVVSPAIPVQVSAPPIDKGPIQDWLINFSPGPDLLQTGTNPLLLLRELRQMGEMRITAVMGAIPPLDEMDPECCYVSWDIRLTTAETRETICDVFIFAEDCCELTVKPAPIEKAVPVAVDQPRLAQRLGKISAQIPDVAITTSRTTHPAFVCRRKSWTSL